jgi:hypothetical protein
MRRAKRVAAGPAASHVLFAEGAPQLEAQAQENGAGDSPRSPFHTGKDRWTLSLLTAVQEPWHRGLGQPGLPAPVAFHLRRGASVYEFLVAWWEEGGVYCSRCG